MELRYLNCYVCGRPIPLVGNGANRRVDRARCCRPESPRVLGVNVKLKPELEAKCEEHYEWLNAEGLLRQRHRSTKR